MNPLEFIYYIGYSAKKSSAIKRQKRLPCKVISVGNITTGGTGKTPAVIALAEEAKKYGYQPVILTRGYKGRASGPCFISRGQGAVLSADDAGDEPVLMAERLKDTPIVKCRDRYEAGMFAIKELSLPPSALNPQPLLFILDDGFQHWSLYRATDILLIDNTNPFGNRRLLPSGILREPLSEMKRADIIVITKQQKAAGGIQQLTDEVRAYNSGAPIFLAEHSPSRLKTPSGRELPLQMLSGKAILGFCGIGSPASFRNTLLRLNADLKGCLTFRDHFRYSQADILRISETAKKCQAEWIVTTEKDIIKLKDFRLPENLAALRIEFNIDSGFYDKIFREN